VAGGRGGNREMEGNDGRKWGGLEYAKGGRFRELSTRRNFQKSAPMDLI